MAIREDLIAQLNDVLGEFAALLERSKYDDASDLPEAELGKFVRSAKLDLRNMAAHGKYTEL
jgi:hypothetical protein